jgi:hypothetical protein
MGTLRSQTNHAGKQVCGISLGEAARDLDNNGKPIKGSEYRWDDARLPNGEIANDGKIIVDESELM